MIITRKHCQRLKSSIVINYKLLNNTMIINNVKFDSISQFEIIIDPITAHDQIELKQKPIHYYRFIHSFFFFTSVSFHASLSPPPANLASDRGFIADISHSTDFREISIRLRFPSEKSDSLSISNSLSRSFFRKMKIVVILVVMLLSYSFASSSGDTTIHTNNWAVLVCTSRFWSNNPPFLSPNLI